MYKIQYALIKKIGFKKFNLNRHLRNIKNPVPITNNKMKLSILVYF